MRQDWVEFDVYNEECESVKSIFRLEHIRGYEYLLKIMNEHAVNNPRASDVDIITHCDIHSKLRTILKEDK